MKRLFALGTILISSYLALSLSIFSTLQMVYIVAIATDREAKPSSYMKAMLPAWLAYSYIYIHGFEEQNFILKLEGEENINIPVLNWLAAGHADPTQYDKKRLLKVAKIAISSGANPNMVDPETGFSPMHDAVLLRDKEFIKFLFNNGALLSIKVSRPGKKSNNLDVINFARLLANGNHQYHHEYSEIVTLLERVNKKNSP